MFKDFIEILILSAVQGISEFLPISSSAHLIIVSSLYDLKASSLLIDISLHLGSLLAIIFFFKKDLFDLKHNHKLLKLIITPPRARIFFGTHRPQIPCDFQGGVTFESRFSRA